MKKVFPDYYIKKEVAVNANTEWIKIDSTNSDKECPPSVDLDKTYNKTDNEHIVKSINLIYEREFLKLYLNKNSYYKFSSQSTNTDFINNKFNFDIDTLKKEFYSSPYANIYINQIFPQKELFGNDIRNIIGMKNDYNYRPINDFLNNRIVTDTFYNYIILQKNVYNFLNDNSGYFFNPDHNFIIQTDNYMKKSIFVWYLYNFVSDNKFLEFFDKLTTYNTNYELKEDTVSPIYFEVLDKLNKSNNYVKSIWFPKINISKLNILKNNNLYEDIPKLTDIILSSEDFKLNFELHFDFKISNINFTFFYNDNYNDEIKLKDIIDNNESNDESNIYSYTYEIKNSNNNKLINLINDYLKFIGLNQDNPNEKYISDVFNKYIKRIKLENIEREIKYTIQTTNIENNIPVKSDRFINYIRYDDYQGYFPFINLCDDTLLLKIELFDYINEAYIKNSQQGNSSYNIPNIEITNPQDTTDILFLVFENYSNKVINANGDYSTESLKEIQTNFLKDIVMKNIKNYIKQLYDNEIEFLKDILKTGNTKYEINNGNLSVIDVKDYTFMHQSVLIINKEFPGINSDDSNPTSSYINFPELKNGDESSDILKTRLEYTDKDDIIDTIIENIYSKRNNRPTREDEYFYSFKNLDSDDDIVDNILNLHSSGLNQDKNIFLFTIYDDLIMHIYSVLTDINKEKERLLLSNTIDNNIEKYISFYQKMIEKIKKEKINFFNDLNRIFDFIYYYTYGKKITPKYFNDNLKKNHDIVFKFVPEWNKEYTPDYYITKLNGQLEEYTKNDFGEIPGIINYDIFNNINDKLLLYKNSNLFSNFEKKKKIYQQFFQL